jgi:hypothetical protein
MSRLRKATFLGLGTLSLATLGLGLAALLQSSAPSGPVEGPGGALRTEEGRPLSTEGGARPDDDLTAEVSTWRALYAPRSWLDEAGTQALKAERQARAEAIATSIGAGGPDIVASVRERWEAADARERLLLIDGLGRNPSPEAVTALGALYEEAELFRLKEEVLHALGASEGPGHETLLVAVMEGEDERLAQVATMALYGEEAAAEALTAVIYSEAAMNVRLEALHSLSGVEGEAAGAALAAAATSEALEPRVRVYAEHELARRGTAGG